MEYDIKQCLQVLQNGGIILYPTDTVWGIGCDATNAQAVSKIYALKQREEKKSMIILLPHLSNVSLYAKEPSAIINDLLNSADKPTTVIYPEAKNIANNIISEDGTIAIRIVKDIFCETLLKLLGKPIVSTSANLSGSDGATDFKSVSKEIKKGVDYIVKHRQEEEFTSSPSKIILWNSDNEIITIRE